MNQTTLVRFLALQSQLIESCFDKVDLPLDVNANFKLHCKKLSKYIAEMKLLVDASQSTEYERRSNAGGDFDHPCHDDYIKGVQRIPAPVPNGQVNVQPTMIPLTTPPTPKSDQFH